MYQPIDAAIEQECQTIAESMFRLEKRLTL